ncbi:hypothetical protein [Dactylosporangium cerinum]
MTNEDAEPPRLVRPYVAGPAPDPWSPPDRSGRTALLHSRPGRGGAPAPRAARSTGPGPTSGRAPDRGGDAPS